MWTEKKFIFKGNEIEYIVDFPENYKEGERYPVIFYLHGYGFVVAGSMDVLKSDCPVRRERIPADMPFILVAPLCRQISWLIRFETLCAFLEDIVAQPWCDKSRVYLTGSSMGGYTSWLALVEKGHLFTAAVICCGGGQYWMCGTKAYNDIPIKAVHGRLDDTVLCRESEIMVERINANGGKAELIIHEDLSHDVWTRTFTDPATYQWFLSHKKCEK